MVAARGESPGVSRCDRAGSGDFSSRSAARSSRATVRASATERVITRHVSSPASVPTMRGCSSRSSARAIAGAEPSSDWTTTMFCATVARSPNWPSTDSSVSRGSAWRPRPGSDVSRPAERVGRLLEAELADVARHGGLRHRAAGAGERRGELLLAPDPPPRHDACDQTLPFRLGKRTRARLHPVTVIPRFGRVTVRQATRNAEEAALDRSLRGLAAGATIAARRAASKIWTVATGEQPPTKK